MPKPKQNKKVQRNYRVSSLFDLIVKRGAKILDLSEADFLELCVVDRAEELIFRRKTLEKVVLDDEARELSLWVSEAAKHLQNRINQP